MSTFEKSKQTEDDQSMKKQSYQNEMNKTQMETFLKNKQQQVNKKTCKPFSCVPEHYDIQNLLLFLFRISVNAWGWRKNCYHYLTIKCAQRLVPRYHGRHHNF